MLMIAALSEPDTHERRIAHETLPAARRVVEFYRDQAEAATQQHRDDVARIGASLIGQAADRGWCSVHDRVIDELTIKLPERERDVDVTATVELHIRVTATSEVLAREHAEAVVTAAERHLDAMPSITPYPEAPNDYEIEPAGG